MPQHAHTRAPTHADLVTKILTFDVRQRATAEAILQHPWLHTHGVAPDRPIDSIVIQRLRNFAGMTRLRKAAILAAAPSRGCVAGGLARVCSIRCGDERFERHSPGAVGHCRLGAAQRAAVHSWLVPRSRAWRSRAE